MEEDVALNPVELEVNVAVFAAMRGAGGGEAFEAERGGGGETSGESGEPQIDSMSLDLFGEKR